MRHLAAFPDHQAAKPAVPSDLVPLSLEGAKLERMSLKDEPDLGFNIIPYRELEQATEKFADHNCVGKGGFASVFKGTWRGRAVAVKRFQPDKFSAASGYSSIAQMFREARLMGHMIHPNLMTLIGHTRSGEAPCLVLPFMPNGSLFARLQHRDFSMQKRVHVLIGATQGLGHLHANGNIHRDIKSANILLNESDHAVISDFGLAWTVGHTGSDSSVKTHVAAGTEVYQAPEVLRGVISKRADIYAFGVVMLEVLTSKTPFKTRDRPDIVTWLAKPCADALAGDELDGFLPFLDDMWKSGSGPSIACEEICKLAAASLQADKEKRPITDVISVIMLDIVEYSRR